jgi:hypothetical protein
MCKKLNFVYMIDRTKYQCFDFFSIPEKRESIFPTSKKGEKLKEGKKS